MAQTRRSAELIPLEITVAELEAKLRALGFDLIMVDGQTVIDLSEIRSDVPVIVAGDNVPAGPERYAEMMRLLGAGYGTTITFDSIPQGYERFERSLMRACAPPKDCGGQVLRSRKHWVQEKDWQTRQKKKGRRKR